MADMKPGNMSRLRRTPRPALLIMCSWLGPAILATFWGITAWLAALGDTPRSQIAAESRATLDCGDCHQTVVEAWTNSAHAHAATSELFLARLHVSGNEKDCLPCHAPQPVLRTGVTNPVQVRRADIDDGVNCAACHEMLVGVAAARARRDAPCRPKLATQLTSDALCGSCHRAIYEDTLAARAGGLTSRCIVCHMAHDAADGAPPRPDHRFVARPPADTVELRARRDDGIVVEVVNHNPAHAFPGERHNRELMLRLEYEPAGAPYPEVRYHTIRAVAPFGSERRSNDIAAGQTYHHTFPDPGSVASVALLYKRVPWILHAEADVLAQVRLPPPPAKQEAP